LRDDSRCDGRDGPGRVPGQNPVFAVILLRAMFCVLFGLFVMAAWPNLSRRWILVKVIVMVNN